MARALEIGRGLTLPVEAITAATAVVGQRGTGKTSTAVVIAEEVHAAGGRLCVWDPTGAWYGLRSDAKGTGAGLDVVVFGGHHADVPLDQHAGAALAELVAREKYSIVIDLELLSKGAQTRLGADFFESLYHLNREPVTLIIDEAHRPAPQQARETSVDASRCLGGVIDCVTLGRRKGIGVLAVTQRLSRLHKDILEGCEVMLAHRLMGTNDRKAIKDWLQDAAGSDAEAREALAAIGTLARREVLAYAPALGISPPVKRKIRSKRTYDSSATPTLGAAAAAAPSGRAKIDLQDLNKRFASLIEHARSEDPGVLRARIAELEEAHAAARAERVEVPTLPAGMREQIDALLAHAANIEHALTEITAMRRGLSALAHEVTSIAHDAPKTARPPAAGTASGSRSTSGERAVGQRAPAARGTPRAPAAQTTPGSAKQRILDALAALHSIGIAAPRKETLALFAKASPASSAYANNLGALRKDGLVEYPAPGVVALTAAGHAQARPLPAPLTHNELLDYARSLVGPARARLLDPLIDVHPDELTKADLAERAGVSLTSSAYANNLGSLRKLGLVEYPAPGTVAATGLLFPAGLS